MKIESVRVKVHRNHRRFTNDETELVVSVEEGDDWEEIEPILRMKASKLIEEHWREIDELEESTEQKFDGIPF